MTKQRNRLPIQVIAGQVSREFIAKLNCLGRRGIEPEPEQPDDDLQQATADCDQQGSSAFASLQRRFKRIEVSTIAAQLGGSSELLRVSEALSQAMQRKLRSVNLTINSPAIAKISDRMAGVDPKLFQ